MKELLKNIVLIQTGVFAKTSHEGEIVYLKAKHFDENGKLKYRLHPDLKLNKLNEKHLLKKNDIIFSAKGTKNFAALYESHNLPAVASTSFFVLRSRMNASNQCLSEYLVWYLNHYTTQNYLKNRAIGTSTASISKTVLENLEIHIPSVQTQAIILKIIRLRKLEKNLREKIDSLRETLIQQRLNQVINDKL